MTSDPIPTEILPCPFCGEDNAIICTTDCAWNPDGKAYAVSCRTVDCHGAIFNLGYDLFSAPEVAIAAWNRRAK